MNKKSYEMEDGFKRLYRGYVEIQGKIGDI